MNNIPLFYKHKGKWQRVPLELLEEGSFYQLGKIGQFKGLGPLMTQEQHIFLIECWPHFIKMPLKPVRKQKDIAWFIFSPLLTRRQRFMVKHIALWRKLTWGLYGLEHWFLFKLHYVIVVLVVFALSIVISAGLVHLYDVLMSK